MFSVVVLDVEFPSQKVQSPVAKGGVQTQQAQLCDHFLRNDCVVCYTDVYVQYDVHVYVQFVLFV